MSPSNTATFFPSRCFKTANKDVIEDFPTPPLPLTIPMTFLTEE